MRIGKPVGALASIAMATLVVGVGLISAMPAAQARSQGDCTITQDRSLSGAVPTKIEFINETAGPVKTYWLDYNGQRVFYRELVAQASYVQATFDTHPWIAVDRTGKCIGYTIAPIAQYRITDVPALAARIVYATVAVHGKIRTLIVSIRASGNADAKLQLLRRGSILFQSSYRVKALGNILKATLPASLRKGLYQVRITLRDAHQQQKTYSASVTAPG